jgi:pimeloyl-ACP methyl ester carboxylesterase
VIDNPFSVAKSRSEKAGAVLADALINRCQGERPVTLIGYSLGARVIFTCLKTLADRHAFGLVESVVSVVAAVPAARTGPLWSAEE